MSSVLIEFQDVLKKYPPHYQLSIPFLQIKKGFVYLLIGANGTGKSTFVRLCTGSIHQTRGSITHSHGVLGVIPDAVHLPNHLTIDSYLKNLCEVRDPLHTYDDRIAAFCCEWQLNSKQKIGSLSKGMRQKVLIIQALIQYPSCYIFDEALNGLDLSSIKNWIEWIKKLKIHKKTIIIITHDPKLFKPIADVQLTMEEGRISEKTL